MPGPGDRGGRGKPRDTRGTLRRILRYLDQYRWIVFFLLICAFLSNIGNLLGPPLRGRPSVRRKRDRGRWIFKKFLPTHCGCCARIWEATY